MVRYPGIPVVPTGFLNVSTLRHSYKDQSEIAVGEQKVYVGARLQTAGVVHDPFWLSRLCR